MRLTVAERVRNHRKKIKENAEKHAAHKEKDRLRKRESRKKAVDPRKAELERKKCRERVRLHRLKKKLSASHVQDPGDTPVSYAYKTPQALGKAVHKVSPLLPNSPRKRKAVIEKIAKSHGLPLSSEHQKSTGNKCIAKSTVDCVQEFYYRDSISRQAPGRKDYVIMKENGKKLKLQKRHLMWSLKETFGLFQKENPQVKIGFSKFCSLRPKNVLLQAFMPRQVCLCQYHDNVKLLCECLTKEIQSFPSYSAAFVDNFVCDSNKEECMMSKCGSCPAWLDAVKEDAALDEIVQWQQWERVSHQVQSKQGKPKLVKKMEKVTKEGTVEEALHSLQSKMPSFLEHVFVKRKQAEFFEKRTAQMQPDEAVVQVDFAENYTCQHQDEVQAAHWSQQQVTLFTVAIWTKDSDDNTKCSSHVIVSDDLDHDKKSVTVFMDIVVNNFVKKNFPQVKVVDIFSDGPTSQFKNRYMAGFYHTLQRKGLKIKWHFFATSHGKGVVDGLGGTVKRMVWTAVSTRKVANVQDAKSFANVAAQFCKSINIQLCLKKDIDELGSGLVLDKCFQKATAIPGISKVHCIAPAENGQVHCLLYSSQLSVLHEIERSNDAEETCSDSVNEITRSEVSDGSCNNSGDSEDEESSGDGGSDGDVADDEDDTPLCTYATLPADTPMTDEEEIIIQIQQGLPDHIRAILNDHCTEFQIPPFSSLMAGLIISEAIDFKGDPLIDIRDLKELEGKAVEDESKWVTNFIVDAYLQLVKAESAQKGVKVEIFRWEEFEKLVQRQTLKDPLTDKDDLFKQDAVFFPCNDTEGEHWFLGVMFPQEMCIIVLDSLPGQFVKPTVLKRVEMMVSLLLKADRSTDVSQWSFYSNKPGEIPEQNNTYDCGIFSCLYARCVATRSVMIPKTEVLAYRQLMIQELHQKSLCPIPPPTIQPGEYYAVDYVKTYYFGRVMKKSGSFVEFKFLHRNSASTFHWPRRDDVDTVHFSNIFSDPVTVPQFISGPFEIPELPAVEKLFKVIRKHKKV